MTWVKALRDSQLRNGDKEVVNLNGQSILVLRHQDQIFAVASACPHLRFPLKYATLTEDCSIVCAFHHSAFDLKTGDVKAWSPWPPGAGPLFAKMSKEKVLGVYPTKVEDGHIYVELRSVSAVI